MMARPLSVGSTIVVGEFDGLHVGHRRLLDAARGVAGGAGQPLVGVVLWQSVGPAQLHTIDARVRALLSAGCHQAMAVHVPTDERAASSPLIDRIVDTTRASRAVLACPPDPFGLPRYPSLRAGLHARGVEVIEVDRARDPDDRVVSSAGVRAAITSGDVERAAVWLGGPYSIRAVVTHGAKLGRTIGFPTANLVPPDVMVCPAHGVYAARVGVGDTEHAAAVNVGVRPTVTYAGRVLIEAHLLCFDDDIYDTTIEVKFVRRLRGERRFDSIDELVAQLHHDVADVARDTGD